VRDIGAGRIDRDLAAVRVHDQVHIFYGDGAQQHLIAEHQSTNIAKPIAKTHLDRPHIGNVHMPPVGDGFPGSDLFTV